MNRCEMWRMRLVYDESTISGALPLLKDVLTPLGCFCGKMSVVRGGKRAA